MTVSRTNSDKEIRQAFEQAKQIASKDPAVYQQGHARSEFVLKHVRDALPVALQYRVRKDITGLLAAARITTVLPPMALIPAEVRALLDYLAS